MGSLFLLADPRFLGLDVTLSKICSAELAMMNNFIWNELWTFRRSPAPSAKGEVKGDAKFCRKGLGRRFLLFNAICGIGIAFAVLLLHVFHGWFGWTLYAANFFAILSVTLFNFGMNAAFNWRSDIKC